MDFRLPPSKRQRLPLHAPRTRSDFRWRCQLLECEYQPQLMECTRPVPVPVRCRNRRRTRTPGVGPWSPKAERTHQSNAPPIQRSNVIYADPARLPLGSHLARQAQILMLRGWRSTSPSNFRSTGGGRGTAYPRTDQQRPQWRRASGPIVDKRRVAGGAVRQTLRGASGNHHWRPGTWGSVDIWAISMR